VRERLDELAEVQEPITAASRDALVGHEVEVLVDAPGVGRSHREAPEIDGIVRIGQHLPVGEIRTVQVTASQGVDVVAEADLVVPGAAR
jgi:ribosomal protein S12 methylthiotransferase